MYEEEGIEEGEMEGCIVSSSIQIWSVNMV